MCAGFRGKKPPVPAAPCALLSSYQSAMGQIQKPIIIINTENERGPSHDSKSIIT